MYKVNYKKIVETFFVNTERRDFFRGRYTIRNNKRSRIKIQDPMTILAPPQGNMKLTNSMGAEILGRPCGIICTVCQRSLDPFYKVTHHINWVKTSWTNNSCPKGFPALGASDWVPISEGPHIQYTPLIYFPNIRVGEGS